MAAQMSPFMSDLGGVFSSLAADDYTLSCTYTQGHGSDMGSLLGPLLGYPISKSKWDLHPALLRGGMQIKTRFPYRV